MSGTREWLVQWLKDAHAMEEQAETMLNGQLNRLESYPELSERIRLHLDETKRHAARLGTCLERLGEDTSALKDAGGKLLAMAQSLSGVFAGDEVMKGSLGELHLRAHGDRILHGPHCNRRVPRRNGDRPGLRTKSA